MIRKTITLMLLLSALTTLQAQISVVFPDGKKSVYAQGETVKVQILLKSLPETCLDGMKQSKIFPSGLKIKSQAKWKQLPNAQFQKDLVLEVIPVKKKTPKLTILRKVDKENLFHQESFPILYN